MRELYDSLPDVHTGDGFGSQDEVWRARQSS